MLDFVYARIYKCDGVFRHTDLTDGQIGLTALPFFLETFSFDGIIKEKRD